MASPFSENPNPSDTGQTPVDPTIQIKFTLIFGILAFIPFVLFWFYGLDKKSETTPARPSGSNADVPSVNFSDITAEAGITFQHWNGATGEKLLPETMGGGCAFFDFDQDNDPDLFFVNSASWPWNPAPQPSSHALYENDGTGRFKDVTAGSGLDFTSYGMGVAAGDYDGDGRVDLLITGLGGNRLLRNAGAGKFQDTTDSGGLAGRATNWSTSAAWLDFDRDGDLDLFICNYLQWSREIDLKVDYNLPGVGRAYGPPMNFSGAFSLLYRNEGNGRFTDISASAGLQVTNKATGLPLGKSLGVSPIDLDNDGWIDLVVANDTVQNFVFHNNRDGTFAEVGGRSGLAYDKFGSTRGAMGIDTGRFHDDNTLAISIGNFANESTAFYVATQDPLMFADQAIEAGIAAPTRSLLTFGVFFFDYDLNGALDLLTANGHIEPEIQKVHPDQSYRQSPQLFWNSGKRENDFVRVSEEKVGADFHQPLVGRGSAYADIDSDGDLDVVITQAGGAPRLFRNDQQLKHNWIRLKLEGKTPNRDAIGAWIRVRTGKKIVSQQVMPTRGYLSQSELPVTIGLGLSTSVDQIQITWPDGARQDVTGVKLNSLTVVSQK